MFNQKKKTLSLIIGSGLLVLSNSVGASGPTIVTAYTPPALQELTMSIATPVVTGLSSPTSGLIMAIGTAANGLKDAITSLQQIAVQAQANQMKAIATVQNATQVYRNMQSAPDACASISRAAYSQSVKANAAYQKSIYAHRGQVRLGNAPAPADAARQTQAINFNEYCDPSIDPSGCGGGKVTPMTNGNSVAPEQMAGADMQASTLFQGAGAPGHVTNLTFSKAAGGSPNQEGAAQDYINNLLGVDAPRKISQQEYQTPQGQVYEGLRVAYLARMSLAQQAFSSVLATRIPIAGSAQIVQAMMQSDGGASANYIAGRLAQIQQYSPNGDVSPMELLDMEVGRRVDNPDWYTLINTTSDTNALLREQVFMTAQLMKMELMRIKSDELRTALEALAASQEVKQNMKPKLDAAEQAIGQGIAQ